MQSDVLDLYVTHPFLLTYRLCVSCSEPEFGCWTVLQAGWVKRGLARSWQDTGHCTVGHRSVTPSPNRLWFGLVADTPRSSHTGDQPLEQ